MVSGMVRGELLVIGVDGAVPSLIKLFSREGVLPNITGLIENGTFAKAYPYVPCDIPILPANC